MCRLVHTKEGVMSPLSASPWRESVIGLPLGFVACSHTAKSEVSYVSVFDEGSCITRA